MAKPIDPQDAFARLAAEPGAVHLDVRSVPEYEQGHAPGAWNIPLLHATPHGMTPNPDFIAVAARVLPRDALVVVACKAGPRSAMACEALERAGFTNLADLRGGFHGRADGMGCLLAPGWLQSSLPSTTEDTPGRSWQALCQGAP